jgi:GNAT superfamily N-acetyltransferase
MMDSGLSYRILPKETGAQFIWINIDQGENRIGKIRVKINGQTLTVFSIHIFPEFERRGYGRKTIERFKKQYEAVIADRVRPSARGFWSKIGFFPAGNGSYTYRKEYCPRAG